jgi:hypothetical protein
MADPVGETYRSPVWIIRRDYFVFREPEDTLLEYKLRIGGPHVELYLAFVVVFRRDVEVSEVYLYGRSRLSTRD